MNFILNVILRLSAMILILILNIFLIIPFITNATEYDMFFRSVLIFGWVYISILAINELLAINKLLAINELSKTAHKNPYTNKSKETGTHNHLKPQGLGKPLKGD